MRSEAVNVTTVRQQLNMGQAKAEYGGVYWAIHNLGSQICYVGGDDVDSSNGWPVAANGGEFSGEHVMEPPYVVTGSGSTQIRLIVSE